MKAVFYTLGNSDLTFFDINGKEFGRITNQEEKKINFNKEFRGITEKFTKIPCNKEEGKLVFSEPLEYKNIAFKSIGFKIFDAFYKAVGENADKIFLFYTDQSEKHPQDTIFCSQLLDRYITCRYRKSCERICIENDPWDFVEMDKFFRNFIIENQREIDSFEKIIFQLTAGTPAMYTNLALNLINYDTTMIYIKNDKGNSSAVFIDQSYTLHKKFINAQILRELSNLNYTMAKQICINSFYRKNKDIVGLLEDGEKLLNFDYSGYSPEEKLRTVLSRIKFSIECGKYIESLALIVGLGENIMKNLLAEKAQEMGLKISEEELKKKENILKLVENNLFLKNRIENRDYLVSRKDLKDVLVYFRDSITTSELNEKIDTFLKINDDILLKCTQLRDESPYAHGSRGLVEDERMIIIEAYEKLFSFLGRPVNIFDKINSEIGSHLKS